MAIIRRNCFYIALSVCAFAVMCVGVHAQRDLYTTRDLAKPTLPNAPAAIASVQSGNICSGTTASSYSPTIFFSGATKYNLLVLVVGVKDAAGISTPSGYSVAITQTTLSSAPSEAIFYKTAAGGETGVTVNFTGSTRPCVSLFEYSGTSIDSPLHGTGSNVASSGTTLSSGTVSPFASGDLVIAGFLDNSASCPSFTSPTGSGFVDAAFGGVCNAASPNLSLDYLHCLGSGCANSAGVTVGSSTGWRGQIASFYPKVTTGVTNTGTIVQVTAGNGSVTYSNVTGAGTTTVTSIDPTNPTQGTAPSGTTYTSSSPAYDISTTATFTGSNTVCVFAPGITNSTTFANLKLLHKEGATLVDRTTSVNFTTKAVCGSVTSFSPFIVANGSAPSASLVGVSGRVMTADGLGVRNATVLLTDQNGVTHMAVSSSFGYYRFDDVQAGGTCIISVASKRYVFAPLVITVADALSDVDLIASP